MGQGILQMILFFAIGAIVRRSLNQLGGEPEEAQSLNAQAEDLVHAVAVFKLHQDENTSALH